MEKAIEKVIAPKRNLGMEALLRQQQQIQRQRAMEMGRRR
jgi:hypothetical protein